MATSSSKAPRRVLVAGLAIAIALGSAGTAQADDARDEHAKARPKRFTLGLAPLAAIPTAPIVSTYGFGIGARAQGTFAPFGRSHVRPLLALQGLYFPANGASMLTGAFTTGVVIAPREGDWGPYLRVHSGAALAREATSLRLLDRDVRESASWIAVPIGLGAGYRFSPGIDTGAQYEHAFALAPRGTTFGMLGFFVGVVL